MLAVHSADLTASLRDPLTGAPFENSAIPAARMDSSALALLNLIPLPNGPGSSRNFHYTATNRSTQDSLNVRLTRPLAGSEAPQRPGGTRGTGARAFSATLNGQI